MHRSNLAARRALVITAVSAGVLVLGCRKAEQAGPRAESEAPAASPGGPVIVTLATGAVVSPGQSVHVVVEATSTKMMIVGPGISAIDYVAPFEFDLVIPTTAAGSLPIQAFGASATGGFEESNTVTLSVVGGSLQLVQIVPKEMILFGPGSTQQLSVLGTFSDGVTRDITDPSTGTRYRTERPAIATVSPAGVVTAGSPGTVNVYASNGMRQASVNVSVLQSDAP